MRTTLLLIVNGLFPLFHLSAQEITLSGTVTDQSTNQPIPGANVIIGQSERGTVTDIDGNFNLQLPAQDEITLNVSFIGYQTQRRRVTGTSNQADINFTLSADVLNLDELVITGQGEGLSKRRLSTDVTTVSSEQIEQVPVPRLEIALQTQIPNAQLRIASGQPGTASIIRSRGPVSAFVNSAPVIYLDGIRLDNTNTAATLGLNISGNPWQGAVTSAFPDIPVENIERIEFVNGGAATTLFGADAANGILQIFTRKRSNSGFSVSLETTQGVETPTRDFLHFDKTADLLFQTGAVQQYALGLSGGGENFGFSFSGNMFESEGVRIHNRNLNQKYDMVMGVSGQVNDWLDYEGSLSYVNNSFRRVRNGNAGGYTGGWFTESGASLFTGPGFTNNLNEISDEEFAQMQSYVSEAERLQDFDTRVSRFITSQSLRFYPAKNLTIKATGGVDYRVQREQGIVTNEYLNHTRATESGVETNSEGAISTYQRNFLGLTLELTGRHTAEFGDFSLSSTLGGQIFRTEDDQSALIGENLIDGAEVIGAGGNLNAANTRSEQLYFDNVNYGVYLLENIGYQDRYFVEFGLRADGNSAFGDQVGIQLFPKVGVSYILSEEPFFSVDPTLVSSIKLRANLGYAGNRPSAFGWERTIAFGSYGGEQTATFDQPGNPDLGPERTRTVEAGAELGLFNDRVSLQATYYHALTTDAIFRVPPLPSSGLTSTIEANIGEIENYGVELRANVIAWQSPNAEVSFNAAFNTLNNEVLDVSGTAPFPINGFSGRTVQTVVTEGSSIGVIRGNQGVFEDGVMVDTEAQTPLGQTLPRTFGNFGVNVFYRGFNFFTQASYQTGAYAHSFERQFRYFYGASTEGIPNEEIEANGRGNWLNFTDRFVEKTDFLRFRMAGLSYRLPTEWVQSIGNGFIKGVSVSFTVMNPLNFASSSFDPEATQLGGRTQGGPTTGGISYAVQSAPRQWLGSLKINL